MTASFDDYVAARWPQLVRLTVLIGADAHAAEDIVQSALARLYYRWNRVQAVDDPDAYVHRAVINQFLDSKRRLWRREISTDDALESTAANAIDQVDERDMVQRALRVLPAAQRQVLVLRFFADLTEHQTAAVLGIPVGTVKSRAARGLDALAADPELRSALKGGPA